MKVVVIGGGWAGCATHLKLMLTKNVLVLAKYVFYLCNINIITLFFLMITLRSPFIITTLIIICPSPISLLYYYFNIIFLSHTFLKLFPYLFFSLSCVNFIIAFLPNIVKNVCSINLFYFLFCHTT